MPTIIFTANTLIATVQQWTRTTDGHHCAAFDDNTTQVFDNATLAALHPALPGAIEHIINVGHGANGRPYNRRWVWNTYDPVRSISISDKHYVIADYMSLSPSRYCCHQSGYANGLYTLRLLYASDWSEDSPPHLLDMTRLHKAQKTWTAQQLEHHCQGSVTRLNVALTMGLSHSECAKFVFAPVDLQCTPALPDDIDSARDCTRD